ncbi:Glyoxal reductase domain protein [Trichostrongylus colubriformis]|uniref:Glyoxal reductase domain protein n=1 Tax=Trichostrongylus colubriformis TaxID=6319 RepID=A0AAN8F369_TRICO
MGGRLTLTVHLISKGPPLPRISLYHLDLPCVNQVEFHPHFIREDLMDYCRNKKIFFQAYSSLAGHNPDLLEHPTVIDLATKYKITPQIVLLSWAINQGVGIIPKSLQPHRISENLKASEVHFDEDEVQRLRDLNRNKNYVPCEGWLVV